MSLNKKSTSYIGLAVLDLSLFLHLTGAVFSVMIIVLSTCLYSLLLIWAFLRNYVSFLHMKVSYKTYAITIISTLSL